MAAYEDSYLPQLQGVSQQIPRERQEGQVTEQENMLSDTVRGLRRRPGAKRAWSVDVGSSVQPTAYTSFETVVGDVKCEILLDAKKGIIRAFSPAGALLYTSAQIPYLQTTADPNSADLADANKIQMASVAGELFFANVDKVPAAGAAAVVGDPAKISFATVTAGAFNTQYVLKAWYYTLVGPVVTLVHGSLSYTTPDGSSPGDAALSTVEAIAEGLRVQLAAVPGVFIASREGGTIFYEHGNGRGLSTPMGPEYLVASTAGRVEREEHLPREAPEELDQYIATVGLTPSAYRYYRFDHASAQWNECGDFTSPLTITNTPISLTNVGGTWGIDTSVFEGRFAGDNESSPMPDFVGGGITGLAAYQGRLAIMSNDMLYLSASAQPRRFFRSTVLTLLDSDTIGVGSTGTVSAQWRYAVPYNKDLVLFSDTHQAIMPGSASAVTPRTAALLPVSEYTSDMTGKPSVVGRGLMYAVPRSSEHFGVMEMLPAGTENDYTSYDGTEHLPTYFPGSCRFSLSNSVANLAAFGSTTDLSALYVHEYVWSDEKKAQSAWHRWEFPYSIATAYTAGSDVVVVLRAGTLLVACRVAPQAARTQAGVSYAFLDLQSTATVTAGVVAAPAWLLAALPTTEEREAVLAVVAAGEMQGAQIALSYDAGVFTTGLSYQDGSVILGLPYSSSVVPSPPIRKDYKGAKVSTNKMTVLRFIAGTNVSGEFAVQLSDAVPGEMGGEYSSVLYNSPELNLGSPVVGADNSIVIPARTRADSTVLRFISDSTDEFNLVGLEYVAQYHEKIRRAR